MKFYFAPLEGITGYIYRNAFHEFFGKGIHRYYSPFIATAHEGAVRKRSLTDILPENNEGISLVPQVLSNHAQDFISLSKLIRNLGYQEINLNLGCPYGTVVAKGKGAGFLARKEELKDFLSKIYDAGITEISIKTRIGKDSPEEFEELLSLFNQFPVKELIIHPRIQLDFYKNKPNMTVFKAAYLKSQSPLCYNGDIFTREDYERFHESYPQTEQVMLGRGLLQNPGLVREIETGQPMQKVELRRFHDRLYRDYSNVMQEERNTLFKMKELWNYMQYLFEDGDKALKKIRKAQRAADYESAVRELFQAWDVSKEK